MPQAKKVRSVKINDLINASRSTLGSEDLGWSPDFSAPSVGLQSAPGRYGTNYFNFPETIDENLVSEANESTDKRYFLCNG